jgi:hypothetical protein
MTDGKQQPVTGPGGLTAADWNAVGIPLAGPAEAQWSVDLSSPTTTDMGARNPRNGVSPWPAA